MDVNYPETPAGKRSVSQNIYGNWNGYVSGRRFWEFGSAPDAERIAKFWLDGATLEQAYVDRWNEGA